MNMFGRLAVLGWLCCLAPGPARSAEDPDPHPRPNIVFILMDDLRWDELGCTGHPFSRTPHIDRIAAEGVRFTNAFATTPLCSPSRATFFTGRYPHAHGITDNTDRSKASHRLITFPLLLQKAGYETGFVGKWHMGNDNSRRPGFDFWVCVKGQGEYLDPELNENGRVAKVPGYVTDLFNDRAVEFIKRRRTKPFLLCLSHKAVHPDLTQFADGRLSDPSAGVFVPAERHQRIYADCAIPRRPNVADPLDGKPALRRPVDGLPPLGPATGTNDETVRNRLRLLAAADEGVGRIFEAIRVVGKLDDTLVVFTSDHGYFYGEHGLSVERRLAYEEAIRLPLLMRYPRMISVGSVSSPMVLSLDLAPTLLELGGALVPADLHGRSLVPILRGSPWAPRRSFLIEHSSDDVFPRTRRMGYKAVRTDRYKLIKYTDLVGMDELYDLKADPFELRNTIDAPSSRSTLKGLEAELGRLLDESR